jgi:hypothetical protein
MSLVIVSLRGSDWSTGLYEAIHHISNSKCSIHSQFQSNASISEDNRVSESWRTHFLYLYKSCHSITSLSKSI